MTEILAPALRYTRRTQKSGNARDFEYVEIIPYEVRQNTDGSEYLITHAGLIPRIRQTFKAFNVEVLYEDLQPIEIEEPDWRMVDRPRPGQDVILAKIACTERGQVVVPTGDGKSWVICQVCKIYPRTPILIVVASKSEAKNIRDRMLGYFPTTEFGQIGGGRRELDRRITICVNKSLHLVDSMPVTPKIILYDEVHTAASKQTSYLLGHISEPGAKMFGFTATANMRGDGADMAVETLFGPIIHESDYAESLQKGNVVPIRVVMKSVPNGPVLTVKRTDSVNRHGIWRNKLRNQQIASDAREYSAEGQQIMIKVAVVEHGLELLRYLPDFVLVYSSMDKWLFDKYTKEKVISSDEHPLSKHTQDRLQGLFTSGELRKVIATCWNQGVDFPHLEVLIRADGLSAKIQNRQLPGRLSRHAEGKDCGLLIDYMDEFNHTLNERAKVRTREYRKMKWDVRSPRRFGHHQ
jgi:superfamily II DNA or RNA helicase